MTRVILFAILPFLTAPFLSAQKSFEDFLELGKQEMYKSEPNFIAGKKAFQKALEINPASMEAWYRMAYLGYKQFADNPENILNIKKEDAKWISEAFEKSLIHSQIPLTDIPLEPENYIVNTWGFLALRYWNEQKSDSVLWAYQQIPRKYLDPRLLELYRNIMNEVSKDGILLLENEVGFNFFLYLQTVEKFRRDVKVIHTDYFRAVWYCMSVQDYYFPNLHLSKDEMEATILQFMEPQTMKNRKGKILTLPVKVGEPYGRKEWMITKLLVNNQFQNEIFTIATNSNIFTEEFKEYWVIQGLTKKFFDEPVEKPHLLVIENSKKWNLSELKSQNGKFQHAYQLKILQVYRLPFIFFIYNKMLEDKPTAKIIFEALNQTISEDFLPMTKDVKDFFQQLTIVLNQ